MQVKQPSPDELLVSDFPLFAGIASSLLFVISAGVCVPMSLTPPIRAAGVLESALAAFLSGLGVYFAVKWTTLRFDRRTGVMTWSRRGVLGKKAGQIAIVEIQDVVTEFILGGYRGPARKIYRVALVTGSERWPLTEYYSSTQPACEKTRDAIRKFLGLSEAPCA